MDAPRLLMTSLSQHRWTQTAAWCALLSVVWGVAITIWTWLDNRGQPWLWWALAVYVPPPLLLCGASCLAWRAPGRLKAVGWVLFTLVSVLMGLHLVHTLIDSWS
jgi:hypothetical protein